jgi:hypothetical protein
MRWGWAIAWRWHSCISAGEPRTPFALPHIRGSANHAQVVAEILEPDQLITVHIIDCIARVQRFTEVRIERNKVHIIAYAVLVKVAVAQVAEAIQVVIALIRSVRARIGHVIGAGPVDDSETVVFRVGYAVHIEIRPTNEATIGASRVVAIDIITTAVAIFRSSGRLPGTVRWTGVAILA